MAAAPAGRGRDRHHDDEARAEPVEATRVADLPDAGPVRNRDADPVRNPAADGAEARDSDEALLRQVIARLRAL